MLMILLVQMYLPGKNVRSVKSPFFTGF